MHAAPPAAPGPPQREYYLTLVAVLLVVIVRSAVFVFWDRAHFDADQAITGLMGKHLAEFRAFPLFYYGQSYMLAVEAWLAAPLFALAGASVTTLKLPLLLVNMAIAWLLLRALVTDAGLRPMLAAVPVLFFALPAASTSARLVEANGGNVEPFLYALLLWTLRGRPAWCGFVFGLGFLQREFTLYAFLALLAVEAVQGRLFTRAGLKHRAITLRTAAEVWLVGQFLKQFSSAAGPGTTLSDIARSHDNITELSQRVCLDPATIAPGFARLATEHWPVLFGTAVYPLSDFGISSVVVQGGWWAAPVLALVAIVAVAGGAIVGRRPAHPPGDATLPLFLVLTAAFSATGYVVGRCGGIDFYYTRYDLLSVLGMVGLSAWFLRSVASPRLRTMWLVLATGWFIVTAVPHVRLLVEYVRNPPTDIRGLIVQHLDARGARYALADYWIAYPITFLTDERIIVGSSDYVRIQEYQRQIEALPGGVVRLSREQCDTGYQIVPRLYLCEP